MYRYMLPSDHLACEEVKRMEIYALKEFICLAEIFSFQEAAHRLNMSQSSLSKHILRLEEELEFPLFDRSTRKVQLSKYGEVFYKCSRDIVDAYEETLNELSELARDQANEITVGSLSALGIGEYGIVDLISDFNETFPDFRVKLIEISDLKSDLAAKRCDMIFTPEIFIKDNSYHQIIFKRDRLAVAVTANHPLANEETVTIERLKNENIIEHRASRDITEIEKKIFRKQCREYGFTPNITAIVSFSSTIAQMVAKGFGCTVSFRAHFPATAGVNLVDIAPEVPLNICLVYPRKKRLSKAEQHFVDFVQENISKA